jgi:hypothetical protein
VTVWLCGCVAVWLCGSVALWLCGSVALWLCGSVALWLCVALVELHHRQWMAVKFKSLIPVVYHWQRTYNIVNILVWGFDFGSGDLFFAKGCPSNRSSCQIQIPDSCGISLATNI